MLAHGASRARVDATTSGTSAISCDLYLVEEFGGRRLRAALSRKNLMPRRTTCRYARRRVHTAVARRTRQHEHRPPRETRVIARTDDPRETDQRRGVLVDMWRVVSRNPIAPSSHRQRVDITARRRDAVVSRYLYMRPSNRQRVYAAMSDESAIASCSTRNGFRGSTSRISTTRKMSARCHSSPRRHRRAAHAGNRVRGGRGIATCAPLYSSGNTPRTPSMRTYVRTRARGPRAVCEWANKDSRNKCA